nr:ribonuclease H-like domain-containing protein [Tanacetum cinerariifolium]
MAESSNPKQSTPPQQKDQPQDPRTPIPYDHAPQVDYDQSQITFKANNKVALIYPDHPNKEHFRVVFDFISKCCLREAFTREPTQYKEYLVEFWYTAKVLKDLTKVWFSTPIGGIMGEIGVTSFRNAINYLSHSRDYANPPSIEVVRELFPTIGYSGTIGATYTIKKGFLLPRWRVPVPQIIQCLRARLDDIISNVKKKTKEKFIPYPRFLSLLLEHKMEGYGIDELSQRHFKLQIPLLTSRSRKASSVKNSNPSQPPASTPMVARIHKEALQVTDGPTSLGVTSEVKADHQLIGVVSTSTTEPDYSASTIIHSESASRHDASVDSTAEADPKKSTPNDSVSQQQDVDVDFMDLDSPDDDGPIIVQDKRKKKSMLKSSSCFSSSLPTKLKELPSKISNINGEIKDPGGGEDHSTGHYLSVISKKNCQGCCKKNLNTQPIPTSSPITTILTLPTTTTTTVQFQSPFLYGTLKSASQSEGELIKNKCNEAMSHKEAEEEESETNSKPAVRLTGSMVESSKKKHLKKFDFVCSKRTEVGWTNIYGQIQTRMKNLHKTKQGLEIDFSKPLCEQDPIIKLNNLEDIVGSVPEPFFLLVHLNIKSSKCNIAEDKFNLSSLKTSLTLALQEMIMMVTILKPLTLHHQFLHQHNKSLIPFHPSKNGIIKVLPPKTAEEVMARERKRKARTTFLMALPEDHLTKFHKMADAKEMWEAIKSRFGGNDESKKMQNYLLKQQFEGFSVSTLEGLHKGYDRFQTLLSQLEIHSAGVSHEDANQKFLRSIPSSWSQVALIMRTKPGLDTLSFDDLYNNLRVFERDVKGTTASSSNTQNMTFVSAGNTSRTNDNFHKRTRRKLQFDTKNLVGFDKTKVECFNCHKMGHFARDCRAKGNQDSRRRDAGYNGNKTRDNGRPVYQDDSKALVTIDGKDIDWSGHVEEDA